MEPVIQLLRLLFEVFKSLFECREKRKARRTNDGPSSLVLDEEEQGEGLRLPSVLFISLTFPTFQSFNLTTLCSFNLSGRVRERANLLHAICRDRAYCDHQSGTLI